MFGYFYKYIQVMKKISLIIVAFLFGNVGVFSSYISLTEEQIRSCIGSNMRGFYSLKGEWNKKTAAGLDKVNIPYTEYDVVETEYSRSFSVDSVTLATKNISLYFLGLAGNVELYINNDFLTKIDGETISHNVLIPSNLLNVGNNNIRLRFLKMSNYTKKLIHSNIEYPKPFIGIFREPLLVTSAKTFVKSINQSNDEKQFNISVDIQSVATDLNIAAPNQNNETENYRLEWVLRKVGSKDSPILNSSVIVQVQSSRITNTSFNFPRNILEEWSPSNPNLYSLTIRLRKGETIVDDYSINVANRTIAARGKYILLNGRAIKLLSVEYDEYFPGYGYTRSLRSLENDVLKLKLLGINTFLFSYTNPSPLLLDLCKKNGILVMLQHNVPILELNLEEANYAANTLEYKIATYSNAASVFAIGSNKQELVKRINDRNLLAFDINKIDASNNNLDGIDFNVYSIDFEVNKNNRDKLIAKLANNELPVVLLGQALYKGERLDEAKSTLYNRQSIIHKDLFALFKETNIAGYIAEGFRDRELAYPNFHTFNYDIYKLKKGLIGDNNVERPAFNIIKQLYLNEKSSLLNVSNIKIDFSTFYLVASIILVLILSFVIKKDNKIYTLFQRSILRAHNLYCDIRDERLSYSITIYVLLILELIGIALCSSVFIKFCLYNPNFSYFLSLIFPANILSFLEGIFYSEILLLLFNFILFSLITLILIFFFRIMFAIYRIRTSFNKIYYLVVFLYAPLLSLAILSIFLGRLLILSEVTFWGVAILFILLFAILIKRIIECLAILLDKRILITSILVIVSLILFAILPLCLYLDKTLPFIAKLL